MRDTAGERHTLHHYVFGPEGVGERKNRTIDLLDGQWRAFGGVCPSNDKESSLAIDIAFKFWIDRNPPDDLLAGWRSCSCLRPWLSLRGEASL